MNPEVLRERAARYANRRRRTRTKESRTSCVVLLVAGERLAIPASEVVAVVRSDLSTTLPLTTAPAHVPFAFAFRGEPLLAVALGALAGKAVPEATPERRLVVVAWGTGRAGLVVEALVIVASVDRAAATALTDHAWLPAGAVQGVLPDGVVLVDMEGLVRELAPERKHEA